MKRTPSVSRFRSRKLPTAYALAICLLVGLPETARAFDLGFVAGLDSANQSVAEQPAAPSASGGYGSDASAKVTFAFGALLNFSISPVFSIEPGLIYSTHRTGTAAGYVETNNLVFPVLARYWVTPIVSIGAGPFYSSGVGNYQHVDTAVDTPSQVLTDDYILYSKTDYGFVGSVNLSFPIAPGLNVLGDIRYYQGLANRNPTGAGDAYHTRFSQILAGIQFTY